MTNQLKETVGRPRAKIAELESLRGLLALWVMVAHYAGRTGLSETFAWLPPPGYAVDVFVVLSGFVITKVLLDKPGQTYREFISRRLRRIYPLFACTTLVMAGLFILQQLLDSQTSAPLFILTESFPTDQQVTLTNLPLYLVAHLTLLHGIIPSSILPLVPISLNGPGWSIGLEWQFYLIAPLIIAGVKRGWLIPLCTLFAAVMIWRWNYLPVDIIGSFLSSHIEFFAIGIVSQFAYRHLRIQNSPTILFVAGLALCVCAFPSLIHLLYKRHLFEPSGALPLAIWFSFWLASLGQDQGTIWARIHESLPLRWLGSRSYSIYLVHLPAFALWTLLTPSHLSGVTTFVAAGLLTFLASELTYRHIELRFMSSPTRLT